MKRRNIIIGALAVVAIGAVSWANSRVYLGYAIIPEVEAVNTHGKLKHALMECRYFDLHNGRYNVPIWPPGTDPLTVLPDGTVLLVAKDGCPGRWPWQKGPFDN